MPEFNFNYCKSIFKFLILCLWIKILLFNYNIQNNLTIIIYRKMKWRWKGTYIETKVANRAGWAWFVCAVVWHWQWGGGGAAVVQVAVVVWWWWRRHRGGG